MSNPSPLSKQQLATQNELSGCIDTHVHVFDPASFPYDAARLYTPSAATLASLESRNRSHGIAQTVLVQPSVYGTDNRCLLSAIAEGGASRYRGIAVVDLSQVSCAQLDGLHAGGVRGIRLNLAVSGETDRNTIAAQLASAAAAVRRADWCMQIHCDASVLRDLGAHLRSFCCPVVLDHFGGLHAEDVGAASNNSNLHALFDLLDSGNVYVKLSALYRASRIAEPHTDLEALATQLIERRPDRLLWGSDWPHTGGGVGDGRRDPSRIEPFRTVNLADTLTLLTRWCGSDAVRRQIFFSNPAALYGFDMRPSPAAIH